MSLSPLTVPARGFTLLELTIVIAIVGLLLGGILVPLATQVQVRRIDDTRKQLEHVKDALIGFAIVTGRLPCPDLDHPRDGIENTPCSQGTEGNLPYASLGISAAGDAWGQPFRYRSDDNFNQDLGILFPPDTESATSENGMRVYNRAGEVLTDTSLNTNNPVAIVFSCGKNGIPDGENDPDSNVDSVANCGGNAAVMPNNSYVQDVPTAGVFDDILVWLSKNILIARITTAGTWP